MEAGVDSACRLVEFSAELSDALCGLRCLAQVLADGEHLDVFLEQTELSRCELAPVPSLPST